MEDLKRNLGDLIQQYEQADKRQTEADVREAVQIARLSRGDRERIGEVLVAVRKYGA